MIPWNAASSAFILTYIMSLEDSSYTTAAIYLITLNPVM